MNLCLRGKSRLTVRTRLESILCAHAKPQTAAVIGSAPHSNFVCFLMELFRTMSASPKPEPLKLPTNYRLSTCRTH